MNNNIKELYKALNLSQIEFARRLGVTQSSISQIESNKTGLSSRMITTICAVFPRVSRVWLETGAGEIFIEPDTPLPDEDMLLSMYRRLKGIDAAYGKELIDFAKFLLSDASPPVPATKKRRINEK